MTQPGSCYNWFEEEGGKITPPVKQRNREEQMQANLSRARHDHLEPGRTRQFPCVSVACNLQRGPRELGEAEQAEAVQPGERPGAHAGFH